MNNSFELAGKMIGDGHPCFITYELGPTHNGIDLLNDLFRQRRCRC